ncbi:hypothetical protein [Streptomyces griseosporeus]|uniref:hypothetical protein n=1 Tax=Streptomyces griseosporeus TaxID=1910 RepID=UPI0036FD0F5D
MMRWLLLGALIGLLIAFPPLLNAVRALLGHPYLIAFGLGLAARPHLPLTGRRAQ